MVREAKVGKEKKPWLTILKKEERMKKLIFCLVVLWAAPSKEVKGESWETWGTWVRSPAASQAFHRKAHQRAERFRLHRQSPFGERRKCCGRTRNLYYERSCRLSRERGKSFYPRNSVRKFHSRERNFSPSFLYQKHRCRRSSYPRKMGFGRNRYGRR